MKLAGLHRAERAGRGDLRRVGLAFLLAVAFAGPGAAGEVGLDVPARVEPGRSFEVAWQGPDASGDFIAVAEPGAAPARFLAYARTSRGNPAVLTAPEPGAYEVRYVAAAGLSVLAAAPLDVAAGSANSGESGIAAPSDVEAGDELAIAVADPGDPADYVTIVAAGAPDDAFGPYARFGTGAGEVALVAPEAPGDYEIRHVRAASLSVLARAPLTVRPAPAPQSPPASTEEPATEAAAARAATSAGSGTAVRLMALVAVDRGRPFRVAWTGPGAQGDRIAIVPEGRGPGDALASGPAGEGSPLRLVAPEAPGDYAIVYVGGADDAVLAQRGLEVR